MQRNKIMLQVLSLLAVYWFQSGFSLKPIETLLLNPCGGTSMSGGLKISLGMKVTPNISLCMPAQKTDEKHSKFNA